MKIIKLFFYASLMISKILYADENITENLPDHSNQYIDVGTPNTKKIRLAIPVFYLNNLTPTTQKILLETTNRFKDILEFTNWFYFIPNEAFEFHTHPAVSTFKPDDWKLVQADFVILGKFLPYNKSYFSLSLKAINPSTNNIIVEKTYIDIALNSDLPLRDFGDMLIKAITGTPGPFMTHLAFVGRSVQKSKTSDIFISDFDGSHAYPITQNNTINISPAWSPDGKKISYTSFKTGKAEIFEYTLSTKNTRQMTFENANSSGSTWDDTGEYIAFSSSTRNGMTHIYSISAISADESKQPLVTSGNINVEPAFSPNGVYLAYTSNIFSRPMIFLYDFDDRVTKRLTFAGWYNASPAWNPHSEQIAFASFDKDIDRWDLFKINVDGSSLTRLTLKEGDNEKPSWSPDGRFIVFQSNRGQPPNENVIKSNPYKLYLMSADGTNKKVLSTSIYDCRQPAWSARFSIDKN